jgi:hypothetical protein
LGFGIILAVIGLAAWGLVTVFGGSGNKSTPPAAAPAVAVSGSHAASAKAKAKAAPSPSCTRTTTFDYIERTTEPGLQPQADEIGNTDYSDCTDSLTNFQAEAGQADGECTTIALASSNPGYNADANPAPPLRDVIESAGPGC